MNKGAILSVFVLFALVTGVSAAGAYMYYPSTYQPTSYSGYNNGYGTSYSYRAPSEGGVYPSYTYTPTITNNVASSRDNYDSYSSQYWGPVIERTFKYDESIDMQKRDKFTKTISVRESGRYMGAFQSVGANSQSSERYTNDYRLNSPNPTSYNGGSYWRYSPEYDYRDYGKESYTEDYYYKPRYDSQGYYNWRY